MSAPTRRAVLRGSLALAASALGVPLAAPRADAASGIQESFWRVEDFGRVGTRSGTVADARGLTIGTPTSWRNDAGATWDTATWESPVVSSPFPWTELVASWNADTPAGTWVEVTARGYDAGGTPSRWFVMGRWCALDPGQGGAIQRASVAGQSGPDGSVATDTLRAGRWYGGWQLRVTLLRRAGTTATPALRLLGAVATGRSASSLATLPTSRFGGTVRTLAVPTLSQEVHSGHYKQWGGGGESWCSATSTAMVLDWYGAGATAAERGWVSPAVDARADAQVDATARWVYDAAYDGTGNWPFNTAIAGTRTAYDGRRLEGYVTRLADLAAAEHFIARGHPLVVSASFTAAQLTGAGYGTDGHLLVLAGFDAAGHPVVNDPASHLLPDNGQVRVTYDRAQFEQAWSASGRTAYVIRPVETPRVLAPGERFVPRRERPFTP